MKLTTKRIIEKLWSGVAKFKDKYLKIHFGNFGDGVFLLKSW